MNMKIKILGTNYDNFSLLVNDNIIVNLGKESINKLLKEGHDLTKIDTIIFTNLEESSMLDYPLLLVSLDRLGVRHKINIYLPKNGRITLNEYLENIYDTYFNAYIEEYFVFTETYDKLLINENDNSFKFIETNTLNYGIIINEKLGITINAPISNEVKEIYKKSDLLLTDCSLLEGNNKNKGIDDLIALSNEFSGVKIIPLFMNNIIKEEIKSLNLNNVLLIGDSYSCFIN